MKVCIVVGGAGYIGTNLCRRIVAEKIFDRIIVLDIESPLVAVEYVEYMTQDVRERIELSLPEICNVADSWLFNLAAVHREPGHASEEYFNTNIGGARSVNAFLERSGIKNLFFTSSIAPYGASRTQRDEDSACYPETPYGISKWLAEEIHGGWLNRSADRRLIICRPSVIYGPGDPGNVLRMIKGIRKGTFFIPGDASIVKSHGYIYGLLDSILFTMKKRERYILYNYAENPCIPLGEMVDVVKDMYEIKRPTPRLPLALLILFARLIVLFYPASPIHPVRVRKAAFPTNIRPSYLVENGFEFKYSFEKSLKHWCLTLPEDFDRGIL
jgi:nucleoside-diphosphate-sugar epimerase